MSAVKSAIELFDYWQGKLVKEGSEWKGPCPFCNPKSHDGGAVFEGTNRFHFYHDLKGAFCRVCDADGRGSIGARKGYWRLKDIALRFGLELDSDFINEVPEQEEKPLQNLWTDKQVEYAHSKVDYQWWWQNYYWPKDLVDHFKLGMGNLYPNRWTEDYHLIPMKGLLKYGEAPIEYYYIAARFYKDGKKIKERSPGSSKPYLWLYRGDENDKTLALVEGDTDGITAYHLGFKNFAATFGARTWTNDKVELIKSLGFDRIIVLADGDAAGRALARHQMETCLRAGLSDIWFLDWPDGDERDISNLYKDFTAIRDTRAFIDNHLARPTDQIERRVNPYFNPDGPRSLVTLDDLREGMKAEIDGFLLIYDTLYRRGKGVALHLQAPPGAGKTHILIQTAERIALQVIEAKKLERERLEAYLVSQREALKSDPTSQSLYEENIKATEKQLENFTYTAVAWYGQYKAGWEDLIQTGANPELWYNYEARNDDNCQNMKRVNELGSKNHDIGLFCKTACPFYRHCQENGYWKQEEERKSKPITFFRHQHLMANHEQDYLALVVVDEFAGPILENDPIRFESKHIYPSFEGWELDVVSEEMVLAIQNFAEALRATLSSNAGAPMHLPNGDNNPDYTLSGAKFLAKLDQHAKSISGMDLLDLMTSIDRKALHQNYQPHFTGGADDPVHMRCLPQAYDVIMREILDYDQDPNHKYPSCLHLVSGHLEIYAPQKVKNRQKTPMLIADATGLPALYQAMFGREIRLYSPLIRNPNAEIQVIRGSDWTKTNIRKQLGTAMRDRKKAAAKLVPTLDGGDFDLEAVPAGEDTYGSQILREAMQITQTLASRHKSILVVTHKDLKELIESLVETAWKDDEERKPLVDQISFGHYGALRGTNKYKDYEAVVLIGVFRVPYNVVWRKIQMWAWLLGIKEEISPNIIKREDGQGGTYPSFEHQFADAIVTMVEAGEITQSAARIRPHSSNAKKFVYVFANRPAVQFVSKVTSKTDFLRGQEGTQHEELYNFVRVTLLEKRSLPSYSIMREKFQTSNRTIMKIIAKVKMELNLK